MFSATDTTSVFCEDDNGAVDDDDAVVVGVGSEERCDVGYSL